MTLNLFDTLNLLVFSGEHFLATLPYQDDILKAKLKEIPGAKWNSQTKTWTIPATSDHVAALRNIPEFEWSSEAVRMAMTIPLREAELTELSKSLGTDAEWPGFGFVPKRFQNAGVEYMLRQKRVILADEPGLGKTIQVAAALFASSGYPALIVCPPSLKYLWLDELHKAIPGKVVIVAGKTTPLAQILMADVVITNYQQLIGFRTYEDADKKKRRTSFTDDTKREAIPSPLAQGLMQAGIKMIALDEGHSIKDPGTAQTMVLMAMRHGIPYRFVVTGTPAPNRTAEFVSYFKFLDVLDAFGGWMHVMKYYCGFRRGKFGMEAKESLHTLELHNKLRALCYVRRKKIDVAAELGPKTRTTYPVDIDNWDEYEFAEQEIAQWAKNSVRKNQDFLASIATLDSADRERAIIVREWEKFHAAESNEAIVRITALKEIAARGKLASAIEWIKNFKESGEKLVVFAMSRALIAALLKTFPDAARIISDDCAEERQRNRDRFQEDPDCWLLIGAMGPNLNACPAGVGWTLTASSNTFFFQLGWNAAHHDQCEDRCHRIGTVHNVTAHYMLGRNTIDMDNAELIEKKRTMNAQLQDGIEAPNEAPIVDEMMLRLARKAK